MDPSSPLPFFPAQISLRRAQNLCDSPLFERLFLLTFLSLLIWIRITDSADAICVNITACNRALPAKAIEQYWRWRDFLFTGKYSSGAFSPVVILRSFLQTRRGHYKSHSFKRVASESCLVAQLLTNPSLVTFQATFIFWVWKAKVFG